VRFLEDRVVFFGSVGFGIAEEVKAGRKPWSRHLPTCGNGVVAQKPANYRVCLIRLRNTSICRRREGHFQFLSVGPSLIAQEPPPHEVLRCDQEPLAGSRFAPGLAPGRRQRLGGGDSGANHRHDGSSASPKINQNSALLTWREWERESRPWMGLVGGHSV
jgi:hypothetical protein